jgi:hypothetical protein
MRIVIFIVVLSYPYALSTPKRIICQGHSIAYRSSFRISFTSLFKISSDISSAFTQVSLCKRQTKPRCQKSATGRVLKPKIHKKTMAQGSHQCVVALALVESPLFHPAASNAETV